MTSPAERLTRLANTIRGEALPAALVDLDALDANAERLVRAASGMPIRLASKSVRCRAVLRHVLDHHPSFAGIMAYSALEAVHLASHRFDDILVAYPTVSEAEIEAVARKVAEGSTIVLSVDSVDHVEIHARVARRVGVTLPLCIDVDVASRFPGVFFGVRRSPITSVATARRVAQAIELSGTLRVDGLLAYEAQIAGVRDRLPGDGAKAAIMRELKRRSMLEVVDKRVEIVDMLRARGPLRFVNGGGTGSVNETRLDPSVTEIAVGSGLYAPSLFDGYDGMPLEPAAFFALAVTRVHDATTVVCSGGGYVASGPPAWDRVPTPVWPPGASLLEHEGTGEVQTPLRYRSRSDRPSLGDVVLFRHAKAGELCERFNSLQLLRGADVVARVPTYRGEGLSFF